MKTQKERMLAGELYMANDSELRAQAAIRRQAVFQYNQSQDVEEQEAIIRKLFKSTKKTFSIQPPFYCDYGSNISIGENSFANWDCIFLDVAKIEIGDHVLFGPRVSLLTAGHPLDSEIRATGVEFGQKIRIGDYVWVGGNVVINPGVTIGSHVVIGSGSVITKDVPDHSIVVGNPAKVLRYVAEEDRKYWFEKYQIYLDELKEEQN